MRKFSGLLVAATVLFLPSTGSAQAFAGNSDVTCSLFDLSGVAVSKCSGFWSGNLNNVGAGGATSAAQNAALAALGFGPTTVLQKFDVTDGSAFADFAGSLFGPTVVSFHWGNGVFKKNYPDSENESRTAFYLFDGSTTVDGKVYFSEMMRQSISNATLFYTSDGGGTPTQFGVVPEPATMSLLAMGLTGLAAASRRRRKQ